jgi:hypothetical protein
MFKLFHEIESLHTDIATHARRALIVPLYPGPSGRITKFPNRGALPSLWTTVDGQVKTNFEIVSLVSLTAITVGPVCRDLL